MIPAKKNHFWSWAFSLVAKPLLHKQFQEIYVFGNPPQNPNRKLYLINHSAWWDPIIIFYLNRKWMKSDGYAMMQESGLRKHPIFRRIGGFSINRENPKAILESLRYAVTRLEQNKAVWMFPQGDEQPFDQRPLGFQRGAAYITDQVSDLEVIPISIMYTFESTKKANVYISIGGNPIHDEYASMKREEKTNYLERYCTRELDALKERVVKRDLQGAQPLLRSRGS